MFVCIARCIAVLGALSLATSALAQSNIYAGIEIGGSGAKGFIYELRNDSLLRLSGGAQKARFEGKEINVQQAGAALHLSRAVDNRLVGVASALNEQTLPTDTIKTVSQNVAHLLLQAVVVFEIKMSNIYIFGSSAVEKSRNTDVLVGQIIVEAEKAAREHCRKEPKKCALTADLNKEKMLEMMRERTVDGVTKTPQFGFISAGQEAVFSLLDGVEKVKLPQVTRANTVVVDIGAGNTKMGYLKPDPISKVLLPYTYELPYGTDTLEKRFEGEYDCYKSKSGCGVLDEDSFTQFKKRGVNAAPAFFETFAEAHKNVLVIGGAFWALSKATHLSSTCADFTSFDVADFKQSEQFTKNLKLMLDKQLSKGGSEQCRNKMQQQVDLVLLQYSQKPYALAAGVWLADWITGEMETATTPVKRQIIMPNEQNDWMRWRIMLGIGLLDGIAIESYKPRLSKRSRDISRDDH